MSDAEQAIKIYSEYDYKHVPTIRKFALSNARHRVLIGPFGSGKSTGCLMEIVRRAHLQEPSPVDGIRKTRWAVVRNCYDAYTEILTEKRGWQLFKDLLGDDKVATLVDGYLVYQQPEAVAVYAYEDYMVGFENRYVDFLVTPDHKMYVSRKIPGLKTWTEYGEEAAEALYQQDEPVRVKKNAQWKGEPIDLSVALCEWLGLWFAKGSCDRFGKEKSTRAIITQSCKDAIPYTRKLMRRAGLFFTEWDRKTNIQFVLLRHGKANSVLNIIESQSKVKSIPPQILKAPPKYLRAFLKGFSIGDKAFAAGTVRLSVASKLIADQLQEMAVKAGYACDVKTEIHNNMPTYIVMVYTRHRNHVVLGVPRKQPNKYRGWYRQAYDGLVYCVEMPLVPVYVRRHGKAFWCYRTYGQLKDTTMKTVFEWFPPEQFGTHRVADHDYIIDRFPGVKLELMFRALDRPEHVRNLLSLELTGAWINEAREINRSIWEGLDGRIWRYPSKKNGRQTWGGIIMDSNPPDEDNWLYKLVEEEKPPNLELFRQPGGRSSNAENLANLRPGYYDDLAIGKSEEYVRVYIDAEYGFVSEGKAVYRDTFIDNVHVSKTVLEPYKNVNLILGMDFALMPTAIITQVTPRGRWIILDELIGEGMGIERFCDTLLEPTLNTKYRGLGVFGFGDPAGTQRVQTNEQTCYDVLRQHGFYWIRPAWTNNIMARVTAVEGFLTRLVDREPAFLLSPTCVMLRKGFNGGYRYLDKVSQPEKNIYSHPHDALQYAALYINEKIRRQQRPANIARAARQSYAPATSAGY